MPHRQVPRRRPYKFEIQSLGFPHRLPAEFDGAIPGFAPATADVGRFPAVVPEQDRGVSRNGVVPFAAQQAVDRLPEVLPLQIPQSHIDGRHRRDRDRGPPEIDGAGQHLLPQPLGFERVFADQEFAQSAGDVMAEGSVDDRLDDFRGRIGFPDPFGPVVGANPHKDGVLAAGRFGGDASDP